ncbi:DUF504 domain-containing protein, partial [Candidatus Woesearchaeota archaeon]|nr:DUF504 domain-containing protein [Candidatus Woesearchaeota archaeon]
MIPIHELLNKIRWDEHEDPEDYTLFYWDRVKNKLIRLKYSDILRTEGRHMIVERKTASGTEKVAIPMHRVRKVM